MLCDMHVFDPANTSWTDLSTAVSGPPPIARAYVGFTSEAGRLFVHGGADTDYGTLEI